MSEQRRRRRVDTDDESETPPTRRRRYNTRSAVREQARHRDWRSSPSVSVVRIPFLSLGDYRISTAVSRQGSSPRRAEDSRSGRRHSGLRNRDGASGSRSRDGASGSRSRDGASGSRSRDGASGSRSRDGASGSRSRDAASGSRSREGASGSRSRNGASTAVASSSGSRTTARLSIRRSDSRPRATESTSSPRERRGGHRVRTYTAMSTGGRIGPRRERTRSSPSRSLVRNRPFPPPRHSSADAARRVISRVLDPDRGHRSDDEFTAVMRSLDLVRSRRRNQVVRISRLGERRSENLPLSPRPSRGSNIVNRASSSRGNRSDTNALSPALTIEDIIGIPPASSRISTTARMSTSGRHNLPTLRRRASTTAQTSNAGRTRIATNRGNSDHITYDMTHTGGRLNIRVAFGTEDDDSEATERLFSISGDSDATTYLNSLSDIDMSADDVFYPDTVRQESDSGDSSESGSTATPHSLVSLSLNALHPSPTPSLSSAETNVNMDLDGSATEPEAEEDDEEEEEPTTDEVDDDASAEEPIIIPNTTRGNPIIFLHNNISVHLLSSMAELAETFSSLRDRLQQAGPHHGDGGFRGFTPPRNYPEPTRRRVPEGVDCQRAKLIDELNSNTSECVICTDTIKAVEQVWPCNNCFNIFHLSCIRKWAKTNRATEVGGAWICPVCRRPKFCGPNKLRYRCLCGRLKNPKPRPGVTPHCCGKQCKHDCGLLCHPGPCKMSDAEAAAFASQQQGAESSPGTSEGPVGYKGRVRQEGE